MAKKRKYTPNPKRIAAKLQSMLKAKIKQKDLIDTGLMIESLYVSVDPNGTDFTVHAEDYFKYYPEVLDEVLASREFNQYIANMVADEIIIDLDEF